MDQTCPVVHKSRRPQARLKTVTLFYIHCVPFLVCLNEDKFPHFYCQVVVFPTKLLKRLCLGTFGIVDEISNFENEIFNQLQTYRGTAVAPR
jgi:hypothetical protein